MMKDKIKKLAESPVIGSDEDIQNFAKIMELSEIHTSILYNSKKIIKKYYITSQVNTEEEHIIDNALLLVSGELPDGVKESDDAYNNIQESNTSKEDLQLKDENSKANKEVIGNTYQMFGRDYILTPKGLKRPGSRYPTFSYESSIKLIKENQGINSLQTQDQAMSSTIKDADPTYNVKPSREQILNIARKYEKDDIYVGVNIPADKRKNFKQIINQKIEGKVLVLIDLTLFGSAENAIVITEYGLYFHDDDNEGFVPWQEFYSINIVKSKSDEYEYVLILGDKYKIDISGSNSSLGEIIAFLKGLCSLEDTIKTSPKVNELEDIQPDIDITEALHNPYVTLEQLISKTFLYSSPVYAIATHLANYNINDVEDGAYDIVREHMEILSDKHRLEKIIIEAEKNFTGLFTAGISSTRQDILNFMQTDIGNTFTYDDQALNSLQHEIKSYQNLIIPKIAELYNVSQQLNQYWIQSEEGTGKGLESIIKGGALGAMGAALFGPLGIAAAVGASYLNDTEKEKKKGDLEGTLYDNWSKLHDSFYFIKLKDYYQAYMALSDKISKQFIENYKKAEQQAEQNNKKTEFERYIIGEITGLVSGKEFISMRKELVTMEEMFT